MENLFSEFTKTSKAGWLEQIRKDLKGQPLEELFASFDPDLAIDPFLHEEDRINLDIAGDESKTSNSWLISEKIEAGSPEIINQKSLAALEGGASALHFVIDHPWTVSEFTVALEGVYLDYIFIHFELTLQSDSVRSFLENFENYVKATGLDPDSLNGSVDASGIDNVSGKWIVSAFKGFRFCTIKSKKEYSSATDEISGMLIEAEQALSDADEESALQIIRSFTFELPACNDFYLNIARVKAFKLVWYNLLNAYGIADIQSPFIKGIIRKQADSDPNTAVILASSQALAFGIAGVDLLEIEPFGYDPSAFGDAFSSRIARNIQHILQVESFMDKVVDPAQGSYFMDHLTQQLSLQAWEKFKTHFKDIR